MRCRRPLVQPVRNAPVATGTPLIYTYIKPYGRFEVDFGQRINFEGKAARASGWVYPKGRGE